MEVSYEKYPSSEKSPSWLLTFVPNFKSVCNIVWLQLSWVNDYFNSSYTSETGHSNKPFQFFKIKYFVHFELQDFEWRKAKIQ